MIEYLENVSDTEANEVCPDCQSCTVGGCDCVCATCGTDYAEDEYDELYDDLDEDCCCCCSGTCADEDYCE